MQVVELIEHYRRDTSGRSDVAKVLATGLVLRKIMDMHRQGSISDDHELSEKLATCSRQFFTDALDLADSQIRDVSFNALGIGVYELTKELSENHGVTNKNNEFLREIHSKVEPFEKSVEYLVTTHKKKPWNNVSMKQAAIAVGCSIVASVIISMFISYYEWEARMNGVEFIVKQLCAQEQIDDCPF